MRLNPDFAKRLAKAHGAHYAKHGKRLSQEEIGIAVGGRLGSGAISQQKVQTWFAGREPSYDELRALAAVLEVEIVDLTGPPILGEANITLPALQAKAEGIVDEGTPVAPKSKFKRSEDAPAKKRRSGS